MRTLDYGGLKFRKPDDAEAMRLLRSFFRAAAQPENTALNVDFWEQFAALLMTAHDARYVEAVILKTLRPDHQHEHTQRSDGLPDGCDPGGHLSATARPIGEGCDTSDGTKKERYTAFGIPMQRNALPQWKGVFLRIVPVRSGRFMAL